MHHFLHFGKLSAILFTFHFLLLGCDASGVKKSDTPEVKKTLKSKNILDTKAPSIMMCTPFSRH
jgi:hypothetical protein